MARSGRRRSRGTWFPVRGTHPESGVETSEILWEVGNPTDGGVTVGVLPVTYDQPREAETHDAGNADSLADQLGSEYVLRRLVGKAHISVNASSPGTPDNYPDAWLVGLGFFVARAQDEGSAGGADIPIGGTNSYVEDYNPLSNHCIREPWIWRRTWILGNASKLAWYESAIPTSSQSIVGELRFPPTTAHYGSVMDGPHIDAKTARRVGQDNRLWVASAVRNFPFSAPRPIPGIVNFALDLRIFGSLRKARNSGTF